MRIYVALLDDLDPLWRASARRIERLLGAEREQSISRRRRRRELAAGNGVGTRHHLLAARDRL